LGDVDHTLAHHPRMRPGLPSGTVTFLFTDVEGSTHLLHELGADLYTEALAKHRRIVRDALAAHNGVEVDTQGDAFFIAFPTAEDAIVAAAEARDGLVADQVRVRMGIHTGTPRLTDEGYIGADVHRAARIASAGHGGQILVSAATVATVGADGMRDLGEHRFKDFDEPISVYQLGDERFPLLRTISNTNLPRPASSFVGRETEVTEVASMLRNGARLLTLTGPGGTGKTRLAIEAAATLVPECKAGVFWIGLAPLRDPALVSETIAQTLGAKDGLADHIGEREMLLLLDNLEQVVEAAAELATLVEECPHLRLLVTSRERLRVRGEVEYPVRPLAEREAVELFSARSGLAPDPTIAELCRRLDNLPLAVELAAARTAALTPAEILERVSQRLDLLSGGRDADARQQTLRSTIAWSYDLLTAEEQRLFSRLAVFAGGCTVDAAERVIDADLDVLQSLVDKSLVRHTDGRFWMLETIREFAGQRFAVADEAGAIKRRHAEYVLALAEEAEPNLLARGSEKWFDRLDLELDNIRAALDFLESQGEIQTALRLAGSLAEFWDQRTLHGDGLTRLDRLLQADESRTPARGKALDAIIPLQAKTGDLEGALRYGEEALALHRSLGDRRGEAGALWGLGYAFLEQGDLDRAEERVGEAVRLYREVGETGYLRWAIRTLAFTYLTRGDLGRARPLYEEALRLAREAGDGALEAGSLGGLVGVALAEGRRIDAARLALESLGFIEDSRDVLMQTSRLGVAAEVLVALGRWSVSAQLVAYSEGRYEDVGAREPWVDRMNAQTLISVRDRLDESAISAAWDRGRRLTSEAAFALARDALAAELPARP
jgi:predicted ATPase/class 3 adenylate cyclase